MWCDSFLIFSRPICVGLLHCQWRCCHHPCAAVPGPVSIWGPFFFSGIDLHYKDKTAVRPSYLYNGNPYTGKTVASNWIALVFMVTIAQKCKCCSQNMAPMRFHYHSDWDIVALFSTRYLYVNSSRSVGAYVQRWCESSHIMHNLQWNDFDSIGCN